MKCKESKEQFTGIYDFEKMERISGKLHFEFKDNQNNTWICESKQKKYPQKKKKETNYLTFFFFIIKGEIKERMPSKEISMKREESGEHFFGTYDFEKQQMISGKGIFRWKENDQNKFWECQGKINILNENFDEIK